MVPAALATLSNATGAENSEVCRALSPRLVQAAHEFEGQMMKELLKPMAGGNSLTVDGGDEDEDAGSGGALGEFASEALGQGLSANGGFGIADRIVRDLSQSGDRHAGAKVTGSLHGNTVMRNSE
jgi:Rod binding domain-containing protein